MMHFIEDSLITYIATITIALDQLTTYIYLYFVGYSPIYR